MAGNERLVERILADARDQAAAIVNSAERKAAERTAAAEAWAKEQTDLGRVSFFARAGKALCAPRGGLPQVDRTDASGPGRRRRNCYSGGRVPGFGRLRQGLTGLCRAQAQGRSQVKRFFGRHGPFGQPIR